ncbi:hypothetical protein BIFCAT_00067 [Bifidobacterium catenulatum DSM 16992 = JCM 1194 = LMG 11043]|uniref:Uncharacterized protein n=1 Tax=Bifidobacterium catenulatum DSM 16992 = JCM 1194 = LMG 11043 TaxID=566552 RepID=B6XSK7_9BIFI|nr:hypothetical protein BIFCAT_00067 [Bifidobacterium catenulatum DSM 16992 = JCM 1194 = LMG 11043]
MELQICSYPHLWITLWISEERAVGKSGITRCIIHKDIHKTANSPAFQRWKMWITSLCIAKNGKKYRPISCVRS